MNEVKYNLVDIHFHTDISFDGNENGDFSIEKVKKLKELINSKNAKALIEVDGGINLTTGKQIVEAGADVLVAGNSVFKAENPAQMIHQLKHLD